MVMKQKIMTIMMLFLVMSVGVFAENVTDDSVTLEVEAGITPDSPFYGIELALERISLALERDAGKRAERALMHAEERLAEVQEMVDENKLEAAERAQERHTEIFTEIEEVISNKDQMPVEALGNSMMLEEKISEHREKVEKVRLSFETKEEFLEEMEALWDAMDGDMSSVEVRIDNAQEKIKVVMENQGVDVEEVEESIREHGLDHAIEVASEKAKERIKAARDKHEMVEFECPTDEQRDEMKYTCENEGFEYEIEYENDCELIVCQYPEDMMYDDMHDMDDIEDHMCPTDEQLDEIKADCENEGFEYEMEYIDDCEFAVCLYSEDYMDMKEEYDEMMDELEEYEEKLEEEIEEYEEKLEEEIEEYEEKLEEE